VSRSSPLQVPIADILRRPASRKNVDTEAKLEELTVIDSLVPADSSARVRLELESLSDGIVVTGVVTAPWEGLCRRCLRPLRGELDAEVKEVFSHNPPDDDVYQLTGDHVDLEPMVRDLLLLELPLAPVCSPDCRGLCTECGADLNTVDCGHHQTSSDPRWAVLDVLREQLGDGE
jgi:uncharacterized protein